ncbi:MAG: hypothetical protein NTW74_20565 [Acidobacteria bacterium]|nr:hypothetical protein [Acidobacteriota bacterium]
MQLIALLLTLGATPHIDRITPLGGQTGTVVAVELIGKDLEGFTTARFDTKEIEWLETSSHTPERVLGRIRISAKAALGPHRLQCVSKSGISNGRLFNVTEFQGLNEVEPNDEFSRAQAIPLKPQVVYGYMKGHGDVDHYRLTAKAGERWLFDAQSIERGGFLESSLQILDAAGNELAFNEDQDEYLETPRLSFRFPKDGDYILKVDQYRGPQGVACGENCGYALHISQLPVVSGIFPLGATPGRPYRVRIIGENLAAVSGAYIQRARGAEHYRLTFPYSIPVDGSDQDLIQVRASRVQAATGRVDAEFQIPKTARPGLWRLWLNTPNGIAEAMSIEMDNDARAIDGILGQGNSYPVELEAGRPFHAWTLAAQLGLPSIDTVLELWSSEGKLLAEHDDLMTGQGTVIGNPDSSLYYTPAKSEKARLTVRDRTDRTGPTYAYRLHMANEAPSFQLITEPAGFTIPAGGKASLEALLIRQPGFDKAVDVWVEGLNSPKAKFRADQQFGTSGDGDNINIPSVPLLIEIPAGTPEGDYPIRVLAKASDGTGPIVEAISTLWIGPNGSRNDTRRPMPSISVHVIP